VSGIGTACKELSCIFFLTSIRPPTVLTYVHLLARLNGHYDRFTLALSSSTFSSIYEKHRHTVIHTFLGTTYDG
jgi:hypothetical protein